MMEMMGGYRLGMTETSAIDAATRRLAQALDALEAAVERRGEADHGMDGLASQVHVLVSDRSKLASDLDTAAARARALETTNREVARRLDSAIETIRAVLAANEQ
jgi:outer membrane murein-binding lipoprotein Lpp